MSYNKLKSINLNMFLLYGVNEGFKKQVTKDYFISDFDGEVQKRMKRWKF